MQHLANLTPQPSRAHQLTAHALPQRPAIAEWVRLPPHQSAKQRGDPFSPLQSVNRCLPLELCCTTPYCNATTCTTLVHYLTATLVRCYYTTLLYAHHTMTVHQCGALVVCHVATLLLYHNVVRAQHIGYVPIDTTM